MANEKNEQEKAAERLAAERAAAAKPQMPAKGAKVPAYEVAPDTGAVKTGNLTRDAIIDIQRGKFVEAGKSTEEALELAVKRGFEMVREEPQK